MHKCKHFSILVFISTAFFLTFVGKSLAEESLSSGADLAIATVDPSNPTSRELAIAEIFDQLGHPYSFLDQADLQMALDDLELVVVTERSALTPLFIDAVLGSEASLMLAFDSAFDWAGQWDSGTNASSRSMRFAPGSHLLSRYRSADAFVVQSSGTAYSMSNLPGPDWSISVSNGSSVGTIFQSTNGQSRAAIFSYDPARLNAVGQSLLVMVFDWLIDRSLTEGILVPAGNAVLVAAGLGACDGQLSANELALRDIFFGYGIDVTCIEPQELISSDLHSARAILATEHPSIDFDTAEAALLDGKVVILMAGSAQALGGQWSNVTSSRDINIKPGIHPLSSWASSRSFRASASGHRNTSSFPAGWIESAGSGTARAIQVRETGEGRGVIFSQAPSSLTDPATNTLEKLLLWSMGEDLIPERTIQPGSVVLVTSGTEEDISGNLPGPEAGLRSLLLSRGYPVEIVRWSRMDRADFSGARAVMAAGYPSIGSEEHLSFLDAGKSTALFFNSALPIFTSMSSGAVDSADRRQLIVERAEGFLKHLEQGDDIVAQTSGSAYSVGGLFEDDWAVLGRNNVPFTSFVNTALQKDSRFATSVVFTYNPDFFTAEGDLIFDKILDSIFDIIFRDRLEE